MRHEPTLPIKLDSTSNGEFAPLPVGGALERAKMLAAARITEHARRTGQSRRAFLASVCGSATTLLTLNEAFAWRGHRGGSFELPRESAFEPVAAAQALGGRQFIFDIQTHMVEPDGAWRRGRPNAMSWLAQTPAGRVRRGRPAALLRCAPLREGGVPRQRHGHGGAVVRAGAAGEQPPLAPGGGAGARAGGCPRERPRLLLHAMVVPNADAAARELERMAEAHRTMASRPGRSTRSGGRSASGGGSTTRASACRSSRRRGGWA